MKAKNTIAKMIFAATVAMSAIAYCRGFHHSPPPMHYGPRMHHVHHSAWGHNGRYFWPGFVGATIGTLVASTIVPPPPPSPVVVQQPTPVVVTPAPVVVQPSVMIPSRPVVYRTW